METLISLSLYLLKSYPLFDKAAKLCNASEVVCIWRRWLISLKLLNEWVAEGFAYFRPWWPSLFSYYLGRNNEEYQKVFWRFFLNFRYHIIYGSAAESFLFILKFISNHGIMGIYCKWKRIDGVDFHIAETLNLKNKLESHLFIRLWKDFIKS